MAEQNPKLKTKICKFWEITKNCRKGANCQYAHGKFELGSKITQLDSEAEVKVAKQLEFPKDETKTRPKINVLCRYFSQGYCKNGFSCRFSHEKNSNNEKPEKSDNLSENQDFSPNYDPDFDYHYSYYKEDYGPMFANPSQDIGHSYGKYGYGGEEWFTYLDANGIDPNSD